MIRALFLIFTFAIAFTSHAQGFRFIEPSQYFCHKTENDFVIDGNIHKEVWSKAEWTNPFVDIEGHDAEKPYYETKAKMLWSNKYLYFAFELKEEHIWATLTQKDAVIYHNNDIEIFIDTNGDTHDYFELELNAFNTIWDLFLSRPYREGGPVLNGFDFAGLKTAVQINGTLNNPNDIDKSWTVEVAIPWSNLITSSSHRRLPRHGEHMRINFSRVQWDTEIADGNYRKKTNAETGKPLPENNWVWSPTGVIDMHRPELWGIVFFTDNAKPAESASLYQKDTEELRQLLAFVYKEQKKWKRSEGKWAPTLAKLNIAPELIRKYGLKMNVMTYSFEAYGTTPKSKVRYCCNNEGRLIKIN